MNLAGCILAPYLIQNDTSCVYIPEALAKTLGIEDNGAGKTLAFGSLKVPVTVHLLQDVSRSENLVWLSKDLFSVLNIPENISLGVVYLQPSVVKIGPLLGVLTERKLLNKYLRGRSTREEFDFYVEAGEEISALVFVFNLYDVDWQKKSVTGYVRFKDDSGIARWQETRLPFPDGIHNRISFAANSPVNEEMKVFERTMQDIVIMNRITAISKWDVGEIVRAYSPAREFLPETRQMKGAQAIADMSETYDTLFLKPVRRSLGLGIIKLEKTAADTYRAIYRESKKNHQLDGSIEDILKHVQAVMGNRQYIVQQGIALATYRGRVFDLRVTMQKGMDGCWSLSSWGTRVAAKGNTVTNVAAGGEAIPIETVFAAVFPHNSQDVMKKIYHAAVTICTALERGIEGVGDVGLDIGVDHEGNPYLIEANFRDHRLTVEEMDDQESWAITYKKPIYYLKHLYEEKLASRSYSPDYD